MKKVRFALPKGHLAEVTFKTLERAGYIVSGGERTYRPSINDPRIELKVLRPQEIPIFVSEGLQDIGITGLDWMNEARANAEVLLDLEYLQVRIVLAIPKFWTTLASLSDLLEEFAQKGVEVIIGALKDPQFGPALMFGLGGIFVEVLKDVSFRVAPITKFDAKEMIQEIKGYPILTGIRGQEARDIKALTNILLQVSKLVIDYPVINQLDLNPVFSYAKGAKCVDARIILEEPNKSQ